MKQLVKEIGQAILGTEHDFTRGNIVKAIVIISIPVVFEMITESVFFLVDIYFISKLGTIEAAAVGLTESMLTIIYSFAMGLAMGVTAYVSRRYGEGKKYRASVGVVQGAFLGLVVGLVFGLIGIFKAKELLTLMGATPDMVEAGYGYTVILLGGNVIIMQLFILNAAFRGAGDTLISMAVLIVANFINIILDPVLIFGLGPFPAMGVKGAAIATTIGRGTGVIILVYLLLSGRRRISVKLKHLVLKLKIIARISWVSLGNLFQFLISTASWILLMRLISTDFGEESVAGYTIAIRIIMFTLLPAWGISTASATLVGQNLGASFPRRAETSVWYTAFGNMVFLSFISISFFLFSDQMMRVFTQDQAVIDVGAQALRIIGIGYVLYSFGMVITQSFNGAGDSYTPALINIICFWIIEIPLAYLLVRNFMVGEKGVFIAITVSESLAGVIGIILFRRGKWKLKKV